MLVISKNEILDKFNLDNWNKIRVNVNQKGAYIYEK